MKTTSYAATYTQRPLQLRQDRRWTFDPNKVFLRRVFFLPYDKSKYVSVEFYPAQNFQPLSDICGTRHLPLVLTAEYVKLVAERLPGLVITMCRNEHFQWSSEDYILKWIALGRTGLRDWHTINTVTLSNYTNRKIYSTYITWSRTNWLCRQRHWAMFKLMYTLQCSLETMLNRHRQHPNLSFMATLWGSLSPV